MKALRFFGAPEVTDVDVPEPQAEEALIRVRRAGVCSTDLEIVKGYMGFEGTLGHELVGEVVGATDAGWMGARVTGEINLSCARCERCLAGLGRHCASRTVLGILGKDGCFAEYVTLPLRNLHRVPDGLSDALAVFAEPLAAAYEILEQIRIAPDDRVAILGDGKLGSLIAMVLQQTGAEVVVVGRHAHKLERLAPLGLRTALADDAIDGDFDVVVEATGSAPGFERARSLLRPRGTLVLKSTYHGKLELDAAPLVIDEITVVGSRCGPFPPALRALAEGRIDPTPLIEDSFALADGVRALEKAAERGVRKVQLVCDG
ncbi:MAG: alcohol dehydrogenase catalytic domain-containing protein [Myxococcota bacterium]|nr:alcohol dehydrogenase catalytic domain-containing protein [Myxococcota bacterium]